MINDAKALERYTRADRGIHLTDKDVKNRIFTILKKKPLRAGELAKRTNISRVTLNKRLPALESEEYIFRDEETGAYSLGEKGRHELDRLRETEWFEEHKREEYLSGTIEG